MSALELLCCCNNVLFWLLFWPSSSLCLYVYFKVLYESTSEESADEDGEQESEEGLLDMEDLGPMMNKMRKTKVKYHCAVI